MAVNFDKYSNYNPNVGVSSVVIGANAPILEVEQNEMQQINKKDIKLLYDTIIGDGNLGVKSKTDTIITTTQFRILGGARFFYKDYIIANDYAERVQGISLNSTAYLFIASKFITAQDPMYRDGYFDPSNPFDGVVPNYILDSRYTEATSRRMVTHWYVAVYSTPPDPSTVGYLASDGYFNIQNGIPIGTRVGTGSIKYSENLVEVSGVLQANTRVTSTTNYFIDPDNGSDTTGLGTFTRPFQTLTYCISKIPLNLNGSSVTINLNAGSTFQSFTTTNADLSGFYNGTITLQSSNSSIPPIIQGSFNISRCSAYVIVQNLIFSGTGICLTVRGCGFVYMTNITSNGASASAAAIRFIDGSRADFRSSSINNRSGSVNGAVYVSNSVVTLTGITGTGSTGIAVIPGAVVQKDITTTLNIINNPNNGLSFNFKGNQISSLVTSGLSCSWGTIIQGYYRVGNEVSGPAMVTVCIGVNTTTALTAHQSYTVSGFPAVADGHTIPVTTDRSSVTETCVLSSGSIIFSPSVSIATDRVVYFSCTYYTTS